MLNNYDFSLLMNLTRLLFAVTIITTFPLATYPCRRALDSMFFMDRPYSYRRLFLWTLLVVGLALLVSILVPDISVVFGITGSTAAMFTSYILPAVFFLRAHRQAGRAPSRGERVGAVAMIVVGAVMYVVVGPREEGWLLMR